MSVDAIHGKAAFVTKTVFFRLSRPARVALASCLGPGPRLISWQGPPARRAAQCAPSVEAPLQAAATAGQLLRQGQLAAVVIQSYQAGWTRASAVGQVASWEWSKSVKRQSVPKCAGQKRPFVLAKTWRALRRSLGRELARSARLLRSIV